MRQNGFWLHRNSLPPYFGGAVAVFVTNPDKSPWKHFIAFKTKGCFCYSCGFFIFRGKLYAVKMTLIKKRPTELWWRCVVHTFTSIWISWLFPDKTLQHIVPSKSICRVIYLFPIRTFPHKLPSIIQIKIPNNQAKQTRRPPPTDSLTHIRNNILLVPT